MAFFTSDPRIAEVYANPEVKQAIGPGSARSWSGTVGGQQGMLSNLGVSSQTTSGAFSYDTPTAEQLWGQLSTGVTSSLGADALAIATGGAYTTPTTGDTSVIDALPETVEYPVDFQPMPTVVDDSGDSATGLWGGTSSYEEQYGGQADWYRAYDYLNMSPFEEGLLSMVPGGTALSTLGALSVGINPYAERMNQMSEFFGLDTYTPVFMEGYEGPGSGAGGFEGLTAGEQRDMLIQQEWDMFASPEERAEFYAEEESTAQALQAAQEQQWQSIVDTGLADYYSQQQELSSEQTAMMQNIAASMQEQYGEFTGATNEQLAQMAAENASMFDSFAEYKQWMGEEFTTLESGLNEQLAQQEAINQGLNSNQIDLMNQIAEDMQSTYGEFAGGVEGQLEQMAAENASMFDSFEEYQDWMSDTPDIGGPSIPEGEDTVEHIVEDTRGTITPIVEEGTYMDTTITTPGGDYVFDGDSGWDSSEDFTEDTGLGTSEWDSSHEDFSWDDDGGSDDGGGDSGGGSYIATAATQALGEEGLKVFEDWRDYMFTALPTFTASFGRYRVTAPKIVAEIDKKDNSKDIYSWIWDMHLKPIFDLIKEDKDSDKALKDYKVMVKDLQNKFLVKEKR